MQPLTSQADTSRPPIEELLLAAVDAANEPPTDPAGDPRVDHVIAEAAKLLCDLSWAAARGKFSYQHAVEMCRVLSSATAEHQATDERTRAVARGLVAAALRLIEPRVGRAMAGGVLKVGLRFCLSALSRPASLEAADSRAERLRQTREEVLTRDTQNLQAAIAQRLAAQIP